METEAPFADIPAWPPTRYTPPLSPDFPSAFDGYRVLFVVVWVRAFGYQPEAWQIAEVRAVLELYPPGHRRAGQLRWRQVVISLARQNGKTEIAAMVGLWALLMKIAPVVVGLASSAEQARLVYKRTMQAIRATPELARKFKALTETRGIQTRDGGAYEIKAAKSAALQGIPIDVGLVDELHILARALWFDLVNGLGGRPNCLVVGITTAGDEDSDLLLHLYEQGEAAILAGDDGRFGFFVHEAPEARIPEDDETLGRYLAHANPSIASGRIDLENAITEVRSMPEIDAIRYRLNRFVKAESAFIPLEAWARCFTRDPFPAGVQPTFVVERTPDWGYASITVAAKLPDGSTYCDVVASFVKPSLSQLANVCVRLSRHNPRTFGMDGYILRDLGRELELRGLPVTICTQADVLNGSSLFFAKVIQRKIKHPGQALMSMQIPRAVRKNVGDGFRVSRINSSVEIDGVMGHVLAVHLAETQQDVPTQIF